MKYLMFIIIAFLSCNTITPREEISCSQNVFYPYALSISNDNGSYDNFYNRFFESLEHLNLRMAYDLLIKNGFSEKRIYGGYYYLIPGSNQIPSIGNYLSYRFADSQEDLDANTLRQLLLKSYNEIDEKNESCIKYLIEMEYDYLSIYEEKTGRASISKINLFKKYLHHGGNIGRPEFLWAKINYDAGIYDEGIYWFRELLSKNKYEGDVCRYFVDYHRRSLNNDSVRYYQNLFRNKYTDTGCDLDLLSQMINAKDKNSFLKSYSDCIANRKVNDSIRANIFLTLYYVEGGNLAKAEEIIFDHYSNDSNFSFSEIQNLERREYFYLFSKVLFSKEFYWDLYSFVITKTGNNEIIPMQNENDFKNYLMLIYFNVKGEVSSNEFENLYNGKIRPILLSRARVLNF